MKRSSGWTQVVFQDAVGIDGEAIEFEWKKVPRIFIIVNSSRDPERLGEKEHPARRAQGPDHLCQCSMTLSGKQMMRIGSWNAEKVKNYARRFSQGHWRVGREVVWKFFLSSKKRMEFYSQQDGTAIQSNWSSCVQKQKKGRSTTHTSVETR